MIHFIQNLLFFWMLIDQFILFNTFFIIFKQLASMNQTFQIRMTKQMGRGAFALKDLQPGTILITLDPRKFLTYEIIAQHSFFWRMQNQHQDFPELYRDKKISFAFLMAFADKYQDQQRFLNKGFFKYLEQLPKHYNNLICWDQNQLNQLQNRDLINRVLDKKQELHNKFDRLKKYLTTSAQDPDEYYGGLFTLSSYQQDSDQHSQKQNNHNENQILNKNDNQHQIFNKNNDQNLTLISHNHEHYIQNEDKQTLNIDCYVPVQRSIEQYQFMCEYIEFQNVLKFYAAIESRYVHYQTDFDKKSQVGALIPILQLFNHSNSGQAVKNSNALIVQKFVKKQQQIFVSYGQIQAQQLLYTYGFLIDQRFDIIKDQYQKNFINYDFQLKNERKQIETLNRQIEALRPQIKKQRKQIQMQRKQLCMRYNQLYLQKLYS